MLYVTLFYNLRFGSSSFVYFHWCASFCLRYCRFQFDCLGFCPAGYELDTADLRNDKPLLWRIRLLYKGMQLTNLFLERSVDHAMLCERCFAFEA